MRHLKSVFLLGLSSLIITAPVQAEHNHAEHHHTEHHKAIDYSAQFESAKLSSDVKIEQCWVRLLPSNLPSAGYFLLHNQKESSIELLAAATPSYQDVMLHETVDVDGMAKMQMTEKIKIPAKETLVFKPGGLHAMFEQPTAALEVGKKMRLELLFSNGEKVATECKVNPAKARSFE